MRLIELVEASEGVAAVAGRREKAERLAELLRRLAPGEVETAVAFLSGSLPQGRAGIGGAAIRAARPAAAAAEPALELGEVDAVLGRLGATTGKGSAAARTELLRGLFARATAPEQDFLVRLLHGELRQGALEGVLLEAVSAAARLPAADVRRAAMLAGGLGPVAAAALEHGAAGLIPYRLELFRPVQPMLAQPAAALEDALARLAGEAAFEAKLDGARIQVHKGGDEVRVYTRALRDVTAAVPEVVAAARALPARELIADGEAIALRPDGTPHPFQVTMRPSGARSTSRSCAPSCRSLLTSSTCSRSTARISWPSRSPAAARRSRR